ncbi:hypothetical protein [Actinoallomurus sp. NPDC052274]|uniref:hypothetical protein n=1 Tax=Actinoallomurus sp. NPDC052274 TaxID=3155420 RepID=UPI0034215977
MTLFTVALFAVSPLLRVAVAAVGVAVSDSAFEPFPRIVPVDVAAARSTAVRPAATTVGDDLFGCARRGVGPVSSARGEGCAPNENRAGHDNRHALRKSHGATASAEVIETKDRIGSFADNQAGGDDCPRQGITALT